MLSDGDMMGAQVGVAVHLTIGAGAQMAPKSGLTREITWSETVGGYPAQTIKPGAPELMRRPGTRYVVGVRGM